MFSDNLESVLSRHHYNVNDIETGVTVHRPKNVIVLRGTKQIGRVTSGERGQTLFYYIVLYV